jgi:pyridoxine kinase
MPTFEGLLSGYLGDVTIGDILLELASEIKSANPNAIWCCDPVMGDTDSGVFVRPGIPEFMKKHFLNGLADMTTPNQFELELFAERPMKCRKDAIDTARSLFIKHGCKVAFITSLRTPDVPADKIETVAVTEKDAWIVQTPFLSQEPVPKGQGVYLKTRSAREALEHATSTLYGLVKASPAGSLDLPLIDDRKDILTPAIRFTAVKADE